MWKGQRACRLDPPQIQAPPPTPAWGGPTIQVGDGRLSVLPPPLPNPPPIDPMYPLLGPSITPSPQHHWSMLLDEPADRRPPPPVVLQPATTTLHSLSSPTR